MAEKIVAVPGEQVARAGATTSGSGKNRKRYVLFEMIMISKTRQLVVNRTMPAPMLFLFLAAWLHGCMAISGGGDISPLAYCTFDNATQHPKHPLVASKGAGLSLSCPFLTREQAPQQVAHPDALGAVTNCLVLTREQHNVRLEYSAEKLPCMPCDVTFALSIDTSPNSYVSLGFKETYAAYFDWDKIGDYPNYWGMSTHDNGGRNVTELGGRIIVGYAHKPPRTGCVREMVADEYVGSVKDAEPDGVIRDKSITSIDGRTELKFTAHLHAGRTASELSWQSLSGFGNQRIMWATGTVGGSGDCSAPLDYHAGARGMAFFNFPGFGSPC